MVMTTKGIMAQLEQFSSLHSENSEIEDHYISLYDEYVSGNDWMHDIFRQDDIDFLAIAPSGRDSSPNNYRKWVGDVYGIRTRHDPQGWKDATHIGGMKLRAKYVAMVAHLYQNLTRDGRVTGALKLTTESDIEELYNRGELTVNGGEPTEDQVRELIDKVERRLEKAQAQVLDHKQEANADEAYHRCIEDLAKYGVCAMELGIREPKRVRNYSTDVIFDEEGGREILDIVSKPSFKDSFVVGQRRVSPYNVLLDPNASGDPQAGLGVFIKERLNFNEVAGLATREGNWDKEVLASLLDNHDPDSIAKSDQNTMDDSRTSLQDMSIPTSTQPFILKKFWGLINSEQLDGWIGTSKILANLKKELIAEHGKEKYSESHSSFEIHLIFVNDKLVYAVPNLYANRKRPVAYDRMIAVEDTNYGFGVMALGRETARAMSDLWSRSKNNATIVGSAMFSYDPAVVDEQTLIFRPGGRIRYKAGSTLVRGSGPAGGFLHQMNFTSVSQELMLLFQKLEGLLDELTLIPSNLVGVSAASQQTATEVTQNLNSAQVILLDIRRSFDREIVAKDLECTFHYLQNDRATPKDALIDANVVVYGAETFALQLLNKQMVTELLQMMPAFLQANQNVVNSFNWKNILSMTMEGIGFDKEKVLNTPELSSQLDQMSMQMQQMAAQMEQANADGQQVAKELEEAEGRIQELMLKNSQLQSQAPVEARLNIEQINNKNLQQELKNQRAKYEQEISSMKSELQALKDGLKNGEGESRRQIRDTERFSSES